MSSACGVFHLIKPHWLLHCSGTSKRVNFASCQAAALPCPSGREQESQWAACVFPLASGKVPPPPSSGLIWHRLCWYYFLWDYMSGMSQWLCQVENYPLKKTKIKVFLTWMYYLIILSHGSMSTWTDTTKRTEKWASGRCSQDLAIEKQAYP